jgi:phosphomannomutase
MFDFLFDVDGTLTPSRGVMTSEFKHSFGLWTNGQKEKRNSVFLVTGSDKQKTIQQVGLPLYRLVDGCYQNCGNQLYKRNRLIKQSPWRMPLSLTIDIMDFVSESRWCGRAANNIEDRVGMANISTVGRDADDELREEYFMWDERNREREEIAGHLSVKYPELEFAIGGEISIDIYPMGKDKSQVLSDMHGKTIFFGDRCHRDGNDYHIANKADKYHCVTDWEETKNILETYYG